MSDTTYADYLKNEKGQIALCYYMSVNPVVERNGRLYPFITNRNVCLAYIDPEDVEAILNKTKVCCGDPTPKRVFRLASEQEVRLWNGTADR